MDSKEMDIREWDAINRVTGEVIPIDMLSIREGGKFNKVYIKEFAGLIGCSGEGANKVLTYMLEIKTEKNVITGTHRGISRDTGVGVATVTRTMKKMMDGGFLRRQHSGVYILNPKAIHYGGVGNKMAILRIWDGLE